MISIRKKLNVFVDSAKFGMFGTVFSCGYKLILCFLRRMNFDDTICAPIAGFISAFALGFEAKGRKNLIMVLVLSRAIDSSINLMESSGVPSLPQNLKFLLIWMLTNLYLQSSMSCNPKVLP